MKSTQFVAGIPAPFMIPYDKVAARYVAGRSGSYIETLSGRASADSNSFGLSSCAVAGCTICALMRQAYSEVKMRARREACAAILVNGRDTMNLNFDRSRVRQRTR